MAACMESPSSPPPPRGAPGAQSHLCTSAHTQSVLQSRRGCWQNADYPCKSFTGPDPGTSCAHCVYYWWNDVMIPCSPQFLSFPRGRFSMLSSCCWPGRAFLPSLAEPCRGCPEGPSSAIEGLGADWPIACPTKTSADKRAACSRLLLSC